MKRIIWLLLAVLLTPVGAGAQDTLATLPPVTVAATRTATSTFATPLATALIDSMILRNTRGYGLDEALRLVPGVLAQSRFGNNDVRITIRGFGARGAGDRSNAGTSRGIRVLTDGMPETEPDGRTAFDFVDLTLAQSMEVVRSNASAVWGNAGGGVISISTVPVLGSSDGYMSVQQMGGSFGLIRSVAEAGTRMGDGLAYFNFSSSSFDGWRVNSESRRNLLTLGAVAPLGSNTVMRVHASGADNHFNIPGPLTQAQIDEDPSQANPTYLQRRERRWNRLARVGVNVEHSLSTNTEITGMFFVNPKYLQRSERNTYRDFTRYHGGGNLLLRTRAQLGESTHNTLLVGADEALQDGAILFYNLTPDGERGSTINQNKREGANNFGFFVHDELRFGEKLTLSLGVRRQDISYYSDNYLNPETNASRTFRKWTPLAGVTWLLGATHSVYANLGGGVEAPAGNETDPVTDGTELITSLNPLLEPIRSTTYELGTKHGWAMSSGPLTNAGLDVALYSTTVLDEVIPYRGGRFYLSAGEVRRSGLEIGVNARSRMGLGVAGAFTFSDNQYERYVIDSTHYGAPGGIADFSGNDVAGVPDSYYGIALDYTVASWVRLQFGVQGVGAFFADDANQVEVPSYSVLNATVALSRPIPLGSRLGIQGFLSVNNLTDKAYVASAFTNPDIVDGVPVAFEPGLPRNVVLSASLRWLH